MAWADELVKLQRVRRAWVRWALELNPGSSWVGPIEQLFGKTADNTGDLPIIGNMVSAGIFNNALANHEFTIEVPSIRTTLLDPVNEWRGRGARPSNQLLQQKLGYYLRQHDDNDEILDELIAIGQIGGVTFPPGQVTLNLGIPGGDLLGEDVGRRLLTTEDWPRALPEHLGRVIPFAYGHLTNNALPVVIVDEEPPEEPPDCPMCTDGIINYSESFANDPATWETAGGWTGDPPGTFNPDPNYPFVYVTQAVQIVPGGGPSGENILTGQGTVSQRINSGILFAQFNGPGTVNNHDVGIRTGTFSFKLRPDATVLAGLNLISFAYYNLINIETAAGAQVSALIGRTGAVGGGVCPVNVRLVWRTAGQVTGLSTLTGQSLTAGVWTDFEFSWQLGTITFEEDCSQTTASDGFVRLKRDGVVWHEATGLAAVGNGNYCASTIRLGMQRLLGDYCSFVFNTTGGTEETEPPVEIPEPPVTPATVDCHDSDGVNDQGAAGRGGWLKALLVDTGGGNPEITDYGVPTSIGAVVQEQPIAAPALSASVQSGGNGAGNGTFYYAAVSLLNGVMSELSNVVSATVSAGQKVHLTWTGTGDVIRIYRSETPTFEAYDVYRYSGNPYSGVDIPLSNGSADDLYPGYDTRGDPPTPDSGDPHWDLQYRQTRYYEVSALYADGTESACSPAVSAGLFPRTAPLTVQVTWSAPTAGSVEVVGYRIRRQSQNHHFEAGYDREWTVAADILSLDDPNTDTSAVTACQTAPTGTGTSGQQKPTYCLTGHTLKAVNQVFVLKPDPASDTNEFVQVLMTEGADYTQEVVERNGNRYHCLIFNEQQRSETCQYYEVSANVDGVESEADGSGYLLTDADEIFEHIMLNIIFNTYRSSVGQYAPIGGKYYLDVEYSPGLFNRDSVEAARLVANDRLSGGYLGAGAIVEKTPARQLIHDLLVSYDLELYQHRGVWYVKRFGSVDRSSLPLLDPNVIGKDTFEPMLEQDKQVNLIPFFAGPIGGGDQEGYLISGEVKDDQSIELYRRIIISEPVYMLWTQDAATANSVVRQYLARFKYPVINAKFRAPVAYYLLPPGAEILVTHPDGFGSAGWVARGCRVLANDLDLDDLTCVLTVREVDDLM